MKRVVYIVLVLLSVTALALPPQDDKTQQQKPAPKGQPKLEVEDESVPDSLVHSRWRIKRTSPVEVADLDSSALDLRMPENIRPQA